jgi:hypothetical protein
MLSPYNHLADSGTGRIEHSPGHLMLYAPYATAPDVGTGPGAPYIEGAGTTWALMIVVRRGFSQSDTHAP